MKIKTLLAILLFATTPLAMADAPVVDINQNQNDVYAQQQSSESLDSAQTKAAAPVPMLPEATKNVVTTETVPVQSIQTAAQDSGQTNPAPIKIKTDSTMNMESMDNSLPQINTASLTTEQRLNRLEQQLNNLVQMNLPARLESLQQTIDKLNGQSEQHDHDLKMVNDQLRNFYIDLERRIAQTKGVAPTGITDNAATGTANLHTDSTTLPAAGSATSEPDQQSVPKEQKTYDEAFSLLQQKQYTTANEKFRTYIKSYPKGANIISAHYWSAECYYLLSQLDQAAFEFKTLLDKYPSSTKSADALLKLGIIHAHTGKTEQAKSEFLKVQQHYPGTTAAQLAKHQLSNLAPR